MAFLSQFLIILSFTLAGEALQRLLPFPIPASVYGLLLLFAALFFVAGLTYKFMAELFQNIATIAASVKDMTITQTEQHEDENLTKLANNVAYIADVLRDMKAQQAENPQKNDAE